MFNNKPINVEAQRVQKVIEDTQNKLQVLSLLNEETFAEVRKNDEDVINHFGLPVGRLMIRHAQLEEEFNNNCLENLEDNRVHMVPLDGENITEEQRKIILDLQVTTQKLVRKFSTDQEMLKKLQLYRQNSSDFAAYMETMGKLDELMAYKLQTSKDEVDTIRKDQRILEDRVTKLQDQYDSKKDAYDKYVEECSKAKELRDKNIEAMKDQINNMRVHNEQRQNELLRQGESNMKDLQKSHEDTMAKLTKQRNQLKTKMQELEKQNGGAEREDRKNFVKVLQDYHNNMNQYDSEMTTNTTENMKFKSEYQDTANDLKEMQAELAGRVAERKKRDEINAIMAKKKDEQNAKIEKLAKACEYIQAHWRGMLSRQEMAKARKGKKKKKKKK